MSSLKQREPPALTQTSVKGSKKIPHGEGIAPGGMLQGCPYAPTLAKLTTFKPLKTMLQRPGVPHADLWWDDINIDISHPDAGVAATQNVEAFGTLKQLLQSEGLTMNMSKTKFVVKKKI